MLNIIVIITWYHSVLIILVLSGGRYQWEGREYREGVKEGGNNYVLMNENGTMRPVESIPRRGKKGIKEE
jgi:hypothetical protein